MSDLTVDKLPDTLKTTAPPPLGPLPAEEPDEPEVPTDEADGVEESKPKVDLDEELAPWLGDAYGDAFSALAFWWANVELDLPDAKVAKRGRQLALMLRKLGWEDMEIIMAVGLVVGVGADLAYLKKAKDEHDRAKEDSS